MGVRRSVRAWVLVGSDSGVRAFRPVDGRSIPVRISSDDVSDGRAAAVAVLPSGSVVAAWTGGRGQANERGAWVVRI
jgi:hypothetical protein